MSYGRPATLREAVTWLQGHPATIAAGCTDLFAATPSQTLAGPVLDITAIEELSGISQSPSGWRIGAATRWSAVAKAALPPAFDALKHAAREIGSVQIQNAGTIGGNLCNASPAADGVPPLLVLDASVEIAGPGGSRLLPLASFITGPRRTALAPGEILAAIQVPASAAGGHSAFLKLGARASLVISILMAAVRVSVTDGRVASAAISIGACSPVAVRLPALEAALQGIPVNDAIGLVTSFDFTSVLAPIADVRADEAYRLQAARELVARALARVLDGERT